MKIKQNKTVEGVKMFAIEYESAAEKRKFFLAHGLFKTGNPSREDLMGIARYDHEVHYSERNRKLSFELVTIKDGVVPIEEFFYNHELANLSLKQVSTHRIIR